MEDGPPPSRQSRCRRTGGLSANFAATLKAAAVARVVAFDEGRFGLKRVVPAAVVHLLDIGRRGSSMIGMNGSGSTSRSRQRRGECCCLLLPHVDTICLESLPRNGAEEWPEERIGVVLDGSGSHRWDKVRGRRGSCRCRCRRTARS